MILPYDAASYPETQRKTEEPLSDRRSAYRSFYADLRTAFLAAGPPTYARLVAIMRELQAENPTRVALGSSALQAMMKRGGRGLPRWETLSAVIEALRLSARQTGLDPEAVGSVQDWHQRLLKAYDEGQGQGGQ